VHTYAETSAVTWRMIVNYCCPIQHALGGMKKTGKIRERETDHHQNLIDGL